MTNGLNPRPGRQEPPIVCHCAACEPKPDTTEREIQAAKVQHAILERMRDRLGEAIDFNGGEKPSTYEVMEIMAGAISEATGMECISMEETDAGGTTSMGAKFLFEGPAGHDEPNDEFQIDEEAPR